MDSGSAGESQAAASGQAADASSADAADTDASDDEGAEVGSDEGGSSDNAGKPSPPTDGGSNAKDASVPDEDSEPLDLDCTTEPRPAECLCAPKADYLCDGGKLQVCAPSGLAWVQAADCVTPEHCDAAQGACTGESCTTDAAARCTDATALRQVCRSGIWQDDPCDEGQFCMAEGACKEIACPGEDTSGCPQPAECHSMGCDDGECLAAAVKDGTKCASGVCSQGSCVGCLTDDDCGGQTARCDTASHECVECLADADCKDDRPSPCSTLTCSRLLSQCVHEYATAGTPCDEGGYCDGRLAFSSCVECLDDTHCPSGKVCEGSVCKAPPAPASVCGNGVVEGTEECDPGAPGATPFNCSKVCRRQSLYTPCDESAGPNSSECIGGTSCYLNLCTRRCESYSDCDFVPEFPDLQIQCPQPRGTTCVIRCSGDAECPPGSVCNGGAVCEGA